MRQSSNVVLTLSPYDLSASRLDDDLYAVGTILKPSSKLFCVNSYVYREGTYIPFFLPRPITNVQNKTFNFSANCERDLN